MASSGQLGERLAERYLRRRGWRILHRNWRGGGGELDIVALRRGLVAFVEVKAREDAGALDDPIRAAQRDRLIRAATAYLARHPALADADARFDVITVAVDGSEGRVTHLQGAFHVPDDAAPSASNRRRSV